MSLESLVGSTFYFDTNIFRESGKTSDDKWCEFQRLTDKYHIRHTCPPRLLIEVFSNIKKSNFGYWKTDLERLKAVCSFNILPQFNLILADYFGLNRQSEGLTPPEDFIKTRDYIINSEDYEDFIRKMPPVKDSVSGLVKPFEDAWRDFNEGVKNFFANLVVDWAESVISLGNTMGIPGHPEAENIRRVLHGSESKRRFLNAMIQIAGGSEHVDELSPTEVDESLNRIEAYFITFMELVGGKLKGEYSHKTLKNYANDLILLMYLGCKDYVFISRDGKLRKKMDDSCKQKERILTFDKAMEELAAMEEMESS